MPRAARQPTIFLPHGGGPYSYVDLGDRPANVEALVGYWRSLAAGLPERPRALLVISAHWEQAQPTVMSHARPPMIFDYYGFPAAAYELNWPAPGAPELAQTIRARLSDAGIAVASDEQRGFDHGTYIPLGRSFPKADIPTTQLSLVHGLDPDQHLAIGHALSGLRDEGVLMLGSGLSYHNLGAFKDPHSDEDARVFDDWLRATTQLPDDQRRTALRNWTSAPRAHRAHPRAEHLLPLMVVAGAADENDRVSHPYQGELFGKLNSAVQFG